MLLQASQLGPGHYVNLVDASGQSIGNMCYDLQILAESPKIVLSRLASSSQAGPADREKDPFLTFKRMANPSLQTDQAWQEPRYPRHSREVKLRSPCSLILSAAEV